MKRNYKQTNWKAIRENLNKFHIKTISLDLHSLDQHINSLITQMNRTIDSHSLDAKTTSLFKTVA